MKIRVLIADDAPFIHDVLAAYLEKLDVEVVGRAKDGAEMLAFALDKKPDLIFADLAMPVKNGLTASAEVLKELPDTNIIAMSSMANEAMIQEAIAAGCVDFIDKSFNLEILRDAVESVRTRIFQVQRKDVANG